MTFDTARITQELPMEHELPKPCLSRVDSLDSINTDSALPDYFSSDELDKLSSCLSEVSNESGKEPTTSMFYDVIQAQLALWTCVFTLLYSYAWGQHRKKFIMSIFIVIPIVFTVSCAISTLLTTIVIVGRLFSTPIAYKEFLRIGDHFNEAQECCDGGAGRRQRSYSGTSSVSMSDDYLPKPLCRRHSSISSLCSRPPSVNRKLSYCYSHYNAPSDDEAQ